MEFKDFGGQFVAGKILDAVKEIETAYNFYKNDQLFLIEYHNLLKTYVGRPSLLYYAKNMTEDLGGAKIYLKREDLNHTGSHKLNNVIGQALLAKKMGKKKLIAETGAGQHGVATATVAALFNMECEIYMGKVDCEKQALNVYKMELLGAKVVQVTNGTQSLKEAVDAALVAWANHLDDTYYLIGSVVGPHPFPTMVRDFQKVIGQEIKQQIIEVEGRNPDMVIACVGGGSNAMGAFYEFVNDKDVMLVGVEASGKGLDTNEHAATLTKGQIGVIHGMKTKVLINERGEIAETHSISSGLDYPGVGPEHAFLESIARVKYVSAADNEALEAFTYLSRVEGIIPALESAHALAEGIKQAKRLSKDKIIVINLSGRGDKDIDYISKYVKVK
jgi:tryptophan synthase beta chain